MRQLFPMSTKKEGKMYYNNIGLYSSDTSIIAFYTRFYMVWIIITES